MSLATDTVMHLQQDTDVDVLIGRYAPLALKIIAKYYDTDRRIQAFGTLFDYDDLFQEVLMALVRASQHQDAEIGEAGFFKTVLLNHVSKLYRWKRKSSDSLDELLEAGLELSIEDVSIQVDNLIAAKAFLSQYLTAKQRMIFYIVAGKHPDYPIGTSEKVIGVYLGCSQAEVSRELTRVKLIFREHGYESGVDWLDYLKVT
jgi:RNA polymerase sigma factor (sigma-70 family)